MYRIVEMRLVTWVCLATLAWALAWVEYFCMYFYSGKLLASPSGWPFCHCVWFPGRGYYDVNLVAIAANLGCCALMLLGTAHVVEKLFQWSKQKRQVRLATIFALTTAIAVIVAILAQHEELVSSEVWAVIGIAPRHTLAPYFLTSWSISNPPIEWLLCIVLIAASGCAVYLLVGQVARLGKVFSATYRRTSLSKPTN